MAITKPLSTHGCEHLSQQAFKQLRQIRASLIKENTSHYRCQECPMSGNLQTMTTHLAKTKHGHAIGPKSTYCSQCKDLVEFVDSSSNPQKRTLAQMAEAEDLYLSTNTSQKICGREGVRGLFNLGETCYMNAVLQMMIHNQLLSSYFLGSGHPVHSCPITRRFENKAELGSDDEDEDEDDDEKPCVGCAMTELFSDAKFAENTVPAWAVNLLYASWRSIPHMAGRGQQDAQEWFIMIVDKLHESVKPQLDKRGHCRCFFHKVFFGRMRNEVTCNSCHTSSVTEEPYSSISLDFKKQMKKKKKALPPDTKVSIPRVAECLKSYTTAETLPVEEYRCRECGEASSALKRSRIRKLPAILCVHVKRFGTKVVNGNYVEEKYGGKIDFPLVLDMSSYTTTHGEDNSKSFIYDLECIVVHQGDHIQNGHYFAFCRQDDRWFRFDDEIVTATTTEDVLRQEAYLLFYSLRSIAKYRGSGQAVNGHGS